MKKHFLNVELGHLALNLTLWVTSVHREAQASFPWKLVKRKRRQWVRELRILAEVSKPPGVTSQVQGQREELKKETSVHLPEINGTRQRSKGEMWALNPLRVPDFTRERLGFQNPGSTPVSLGFILLVCCSRIHLEIRTCRKPSVWWVLTASNGGESGRATGRPRHEARTPRKTEAWCQHAGFFTRL